MAKSPFDAASIKASLQSILEEIHSTDNPDELNQLRSIFRQSVPLFSRAYVCAYLLKKAGIPGAGELGGRRPAAAPTRREQREARPPREAREPRENREPREGREPREPREERPEVAVSRENMTSLFIGIGRTRRVYPRDLMSLLIETCSLPKEAIGAIKILDNYSFVDIHNDHAQAVIDALNNTEFRGRTLSVNFAKKKE